LFKKYVSADVHAFADDLYVTSKNLSEMVQAGMYVGSHGYSHLWLGKANHKTQLEEIQNSLMFLESVGAPTDDWVMCYPHGSYNDETLDILKSKGCLAGLTTKVGVADLQQHPHLEIPRIDTNDLPK
jgi:peptidoglycan/xylan/chitin deacetylase (PgdA/CDA1 family)